MNADAARRRDLASFLRSRRERLRPADLGLPSGSRRRLPGLRREEVAVLAGISPAWYAFLEQGRNIRPSRDVLDSLARVLRLTEDEVRYLHRLAQTPAEESRPLGGGSSPTELVLGMVALFEESPYPVYAGDHYCDLWAWNRAACEWYSDWDAAPVGERNILRWVLLDPAARLRLVKWEEEARDMVARWRAEASRHPADPLIRERIAELTELSPEFRAWWRDQDVAEHRSRVRWFRHDDLGVQAMRIVPLTTPETAPAAMVVHLPAEPGS